MLLQHSGHKTNPELTYFIVNITNGRNALSKIYELVIKYQLPVNHYNSAIQKIIAQCPVPVTFKSHGHAWVSYAICAYLQQKKTHTMHHRLDID